MNAKTILLIIALIGCAWMVLRALAPARELAQAAGHSRTQVRHDLSEPEIRALAAATKAGNVVMYSTTECGYCMQAKQWLTQYGFAFKECNMSLSRECEREFLHYGANGTPFLVVRGHQMKDGFVAEEFLADLQS